MSSRSFSKRQSIKQYVAFQQDWRCKNCHCLLPPRFELDHQIPCWMSTHDRLQNLQALCPTCHSKKTFFDMQIYWDHKKEETTGISKYFDPECYSYIAPLFYSPVSHDLQRKESK